MKCGGESVPSREAGRFFTVRHLDRMRSGASACGGKVAMDAKRGAGAGRCVLVHRCDGMLVGCGVCTGGFFLKNGVKGA